MRLPTFATLLPDGVDALAFFFFGNGGFRKLLVLYLLTVMCTCCRFLDRCIGLGRLQRFFDIIKKKMEAFEIKFIRSKLEVNLVKIRGVVDGLEGEFFKFILASRVNLTHKGGVVIVCCLYLFLSHDHLTMVKILEKIFCQILWCINCLFNGILWLSLLRCINFFFIFELN